jgi:hypothetical protein
LRELLDCITQEDVFDDQPDLLADLACHEVVVARDDLDPYTVALEGLDGVEGALLGRIPNSGLREPICRSLPFCGASQAFFRPAGARS